MPSDPGASLSLQSISKAYGPVRAVESLSLDIAAGEFMTFLGPSGSGKTTTLNMIAGFEEPSSGEIRLGDEDISRRPPHRRGIGMVFQHYALFPHLTVAQNVAYPLRQRGVRRAERTDRVRQALDLVRLPELGSRRPAELSGGQQQRVALARALVYRPPLLLMDEPLGALDRRLRETLQVEIKRIHEELGITFVYVTHDQDEALTLSDRVAVFNNGRLEQVGTAEQLYERPGSRFVAEFLGDSNIFTGVVAAGGRAVRTEDGAEVDVTDCADLAGRTVTLVVRPERMRLTTPGNGARHNVVSGVVTAVRYLGAARKIEIETTSRRRILVREPVDHSPTERPGARVEVCWRSEDGVVVTE